MTDEGTKLLKEARDKLEGGLEFPNKWEPEWSKEDRQLIARIDAYLAKGSDRQDVAERRLEKHQPCGCVVCTCEDDKQCHGCGAKNCGKHPAGEIPNPVYVQDDRQDVAENVREKCIEAAHDHECQTYAECCDCRGAIVQDIRALDLKEILK